jgi:hypothetical protein
MLFTNNTPFPAIAWASLDKTGRDHTSLSARGRFRFADSDENGLWSLKLDTDQGELRGEDHFYEDNRQASVLFESDYTAYKPAADIIVNALAHSPGGAPAKSWLCGLKAVRIGRDPERQEGTATTLLEKVLQVTGPRRWEPQVEKRRILWRLSEPELATQVPLRYEYAYGGQLLNPKREEEGEYDYLLFDDRNPLGRGNVHPSQLEQEAPIPAPQIEDPEDPIGEIGKDHLPQGFGYLHRAWQPRLAKAGTFDEQWQAEKHPLMPDDFDEAHNNGAPEDQQVPGYLRVGDLILLQHLQKDHPTIGLRIPGLYLKARYHLEDDMVPFLLQIDTLVIDLRAEDPEEWSLEIGWRARQPALPGLEGVSLGLIAAESWLKPPEDEEEEDDDEEVA